MATPESAPAPAAAAVAAAASDAKLTAELTAGLTAELTRALLPCEIRVVDAEAREIELCATSEAVDAHGTIFGYDASRDAFSRWVGNVREMHERKAVGRRVAVRYDDDAKRVYVRLRISKGAEDTWEKIKDGTLRGASIGASNVTWRRQRMGGADVPYATRYDLVELSLVDSPSNPDASGVTFVRNAAPDEALLGELPAAAPDEAPDEAAGAPDGVEVGGAATFIREGAGSLSDEDPAAAIAQAALARGRTQVAARKTLENGQELREAGVAAGQSGSGFTANELRLARLGAPAFVQRVQMGVQNAANLRLSLVPASVAASVAASAGSRAIPASDAAPGAGYDVDGDHDGSGSGVGLEHADGLHAFAAHNHPHTGRYDDIHRAQGLHQHEDGTTHAHPFVLRHDHHDHFSSDGEARRSPSVSPSRSVARADVMVAGDSATMNLSAGHSHAHVHRPDHGHFYRVADGSPIDKLLVTGEQLRTREYVGAVAFVGAGGVEGQPLTADQYRVAAGIELRLELAAAERAQGAFSRNPLGAADIGTPAEAQAAPTDEESAAMATGGVRELDRDGQPTTCDDVSSTGTLDVTTPPDGFMELTGRLSAQQADRQAEQQRGLVAQITASVTAEFERMGATLGEMQQRLARIEAQPMPGGPALRVADRTSALTPAAGSSAAQQIESLGALASRIRDPQAQVAVAAEMIRLQQEAAGMPASYQVMPRAGRGWADTGSGNK